MSRPRDLSDEDDEEYPARSRSVPKKKGGYDSRIEQILYENPYLQILITDAGKSNESGGGYIVYTIRTGVIPLEHRYLLEWHMLTVTGSRSAQALLRVQFLAFHARQLTSYTYHSTYPRETLDGRLCSEAYKSQRRHWYYRFTEENASSFPKSLPQNERSSGGWRVVEVLRPEFQLGRDK